MTGADRLHTIAVTSGEPAGVGPDLCAALLDREWRCRIVLIGDRSLFQRLPRHGSRRLALPGFKGGSGGRRAVELLHVPLRAPCTPGRLEPANAPYVLELLDRAVDGCRSGTFDAMATAPVHKGVINDAGIAFTGHTEYLAGRTGIALPVMMLCGAGMRVALVTTHVPLRDVSAAITAERLEAVLRIVDGDLMRRFGIRRPRITVCGLNPHAGEGGHLGREDVDVIVPVVQRLEREGLRVTGPVSADTAFLPERLSGCDVVVAMYHDQGLPVLKQAAFGHAVNVTLGLPIIRTSVDHGTALELAGSGRGDAGSLVAAIAMAAELCSPSRT